MNAYYIYIYKHMYLLPARASTIQMDPCVHITNIYLYKHIYTYIRFASARFDNKNTYVYTYYVSSYMYLYMYTYISKHMHLFASTHFDSWNTRACAYYICLYIYTYINICSCSPVRVSTIKIRACIHMIYIYIYI